MTHPRFGALVAAFVLLAPAGALRAQTMTMFEGDPILVEPEVAAKPYRSLTNSKRSVTNFNVEVVRGVTGNETDTWAINAYASTIVHHAAPLTPPEDIWRTVTNPVSIALHGDHLYVVGQGNYTLARHHSQTGEIEEVLMLRPGAADLVIDAERNEAWVSCMDDDSVMQIALSPLSVVKVWSWGDGLQLKRPRFLHVDPGAPENPNDNRVYVAPLVSGNNTLTSRFQPGSVIDGFDPVFAPQGALPDNDLFCIDPTGTAPVRPILRGVASLIYAHGFNPHNGDYWVLGVREHNLLADSEPELRGRFATNVLAITRAASFPTSGGPVEPDLVINLDDLNPPNEVYDTQRSCSGPYALAFHEPSGWAIVAGQSSQTVLVLNEDGVRQAELKLYADPNVDHHMPRTVLIAPPFAAIYCQGSSTIPLFVVSPTINDTPFHSMPLGFDPTPPSIAHGRRIFYDGTRSKDGRTTCGTCHPQGGADGLAWDLSDKPVDHKGPLVTQTLMSIEHSPPYHWRGERTLQQFNGAFKGLLGGVELEGDDFEDFFEFLFFLQAPANPMQFGPANVDANGKLVLDYSRRIKDSATPHLQTNGLPGTVAKVGDPTDGDDIYHDVNTDGTAPGGSCTACHQDPTGTNGDFTADHPSPVASETASKVAHLFNQLPLKRQPLVDMPLANGSTLPANLLGTGTSQSGGRINLYDFIDFFGLSDQETADVTAFLDLFDSGTAPSVHYCEHVDAQSSASASTWITNRLLRQADKGWVDAIAMGIFPDRNGVPTRFSWVYDTATGLFEPDDPAAVDPQPLAAFFDFATTPELDNVFCGVPPGNGFRLGVDWDNDGLRNGEEAAWGTDEWDPDFDDDGFPDGYEVAHVMTGGDPVVFNPPGPGVGDDDGPMVVDLTIDFVTASSAKLCLTTDEPCTWSISVSTPGGPDHTAFRKTFDTVHTIVVDQLEPSSEFFPDPGMQNKVNTFDGDLVLTDLSGKTTTVPVPSFDTERMVRRDPEVATIVDHIDLLNEVRVGGVYSARADVFVVHREESPPYVPAPLEIVVGQVLKQAANGIDWEVVPATDVTSTALATDLLFACDEDMACGSCKSLDADTILNGPFQVLDCTSGTGLASVDFTVSGLALGQKVKFNVLGVWPADACTTCGDSVVKVSAVFNRTYTFPAVRAENRCVESTL